MLKIVDIRTRVVWISHDRSWLFLEVEADDGTIGLGEASQSRNDEGVIEEVKKLAPQYIGEDPRNLIERRQALLYWPYSGRTLFAAVSGLEQALWDLIGKRAGLPVYQLLGGCMGERRLPTYANIGYAATARDPEAMALSARAAVQDGYGSIKFYPFGIRPKCETVQDVRRWISHGIEIVATVREAVGDNVEILVDLMHQFQDFSEARDVIRQLDPYNLYWIEDPLVHDDPLQLAELRRTMGPRMAGGAPLLSRFQWRPLLEAHSLDVIMPDVKWMGGVSEVKKLAAMAELYGIMVSPHNASGPVATAANIHLSFSISNFLILEHLWAVPPWRIALTKGIEHIESGSFALPLEAGLGVEIDPMVIAQHAQKPNRSHISGIELPMH